MKSVFRHAMRALTRSVDDIDLELAALATADATRSARLTEAEAHRQTVALDGDVEALLQHDAVLARLRAEGEVAAVRRARLVQEREELAEAEAEAERTARYDAAKRASAERRKLLTVEYPKLARELADVLAKADTLGRQIERANRDRPAGKAPVESGEPHRGRPGQPERVITTTETYRVDRKTGRELISYRLDDPDVETRSRPGKPTVVDAVPPGEHMPLSHEVHLPALAWGEPAHWARKISNDEKLGAHFRQSMTGSAFRF